MTETLVDLLAAQSIRTALLVDDAYDPVPTAAELDEDLRNTFFDDLSTIEIDDALSFANDVRERPANSLSNTEFMAWLWNNRDIIAPARILFEAYEQKAASELAFLDSLQERLEALGINCETAGRTFAEAAATADLIFIDLFLGQEQNQDAAQISIDGLKDVMADRPDNPPSVVLMSRNPSLSDYRARFRDEANVFESLFRVEPKRRLSEPGRLERVVERLVIHHDQAMAYIHFLTALRTGLDRATGSTLDLFRKLSLQDVRQLHDLSLVGEKAPLGSYLVDLFDRAHQFELEGQAPIIDRAKTIGSQDFSNILPSHVGGNTDLGQMVARVLSEDPRRLTLPKSTLLDVTFGDVFSVGEEAEAINSLNAVLGSTIDPQTVLLVLTPGCDLQHRPDPQVLLMKGIRRELSAQMPPPISGSLLSQAVRFGTTLFRIEWDKKVLLSAQANTLAELKESGHISAALRLREAHALALSQSVFSSLGRVAELKTAPMTHDVSVMFFRTDGTHRLVELLDDPERERARLYIDDKIRVLLTEAYVDNVMDALDQFPQDQGPRSARRSLEALKGNPVLAHQLMSGLDVTGLKSTPEKPWGTLNTLPGDLKGHIKVGRNVVLGGDAVERSLHNIGLFILIQDRQVDIR